MPFDFSGDCLQAFETLKKLISGPIIVVPNWSLPFICDPSDFAIGIVFGATQVEKFVKFTWMIFFLYLAVSTHVYIA